MKLNLLNVKTVFSAALILGATGLVVAEDAAAKKPTANANATNYFAITGMTCKGCANGLSSELRRVPGVVSVDVSLSNKTATVTCDTNKVSNQKLLDSIKEAGFGGKTVAR